MVSGKPMSSYPNDQWTLDLQELGFDRDAQELARMVVLCSPPFAICVSGRWGSGKTSLMRYTMTYLGGKMQSIKPAIQDDKIEDRNFGGFDKKVQIRDAGEKYVLKGKFRSFWRIKGESDTEDPPVEAPGRITTVWFSPWQFQNDPNPMIPLLHAIRDHFSTWLKTRDKLGRAARALVLGGIQILGNLADAMAQFKKGVFSEIPKVVKQTLSELQADQLETLTDTERFNLLFEHAIDTILGVKVKDEQQDTGTPGHDAKHRLVVFIDDLDRCEGEAPIRLLEAIKLYLSTRNCVFVLGLDVTATEQALTKFWRDRPRGMAGEYLAKLFQTVQHMPVSTRYPVYIHNRLVERGLLVDAKKLGYEASPIDAHETAGTLATILEPNPRKVKNFLNALFLAWDVSHKTRKLETLDLLNFALVHRLQHTAPATYTLLVQGPTKYHPNLRDFFSECIAREFGQHNIDIHIFRVMMGDFGHMTSPDGKKDDRSMDAEPLGVDDLRVRLDGLRADLEFAHVWNTRINSPEIFSRLAGLATPSATPPEPPPSETPEVNDA